jgi:putative ABC transport system permease protein
MTLSSFVEGVSEAGATIRAHPLRAGLAGLAMAAAVATMAVVQTGLDGLARSARAASARAFGSDAFVVARYAAGSLSRRELADRIARSRNITRADVRFLEAFDGDRVRYAATAQRAADVSAGARTFENATISGTQAALFEIRDIPIARGRPFTRAEEERGSAVIVAGREIVDELVPAGEPLGRTVRIASRGFQIVGVMEPQGSAGGVSLDRYVWMPLTAFERAFGAPATWQVFAKAVDVARTEAAEDQARASMRARRRLLPGVADTFDIITPEAARGFVLSIAQRLGAAGPPISFMALLAAIVVVANTTLVSVTERTREIGIRRALGARRAILLVETLAESTLVALAGGTAGLVAAIGVLAAASGVLRMALPLEWPTAIASLAGAGAAGLAAGWFPARRAAGLDVISALRQE